MSIKSFFAGLLGSSIATAAAAFVATDVQKAVAALKKTEVGAAVARAIKTVENDKISGTEKAARVVGEAVPLIVDLLSGGGVRVVVDQVEDIARELVQSIYNDTKSKTAGSIAAAIIKLIKGR